MSIDFGPFKVYKYGLEFDEHQQAVVKMPEFSEILKCALQYGIITLWVKVYPKYDKEDRRFMFIGTGCNIPLNCIYIDTVFDGLFVWHVYEVFEKME